MPTSTKPRKPRAKPAESNHQPGRIWADLASIHQTCLSQLHSATTTAPILKDPTFIAEAVERGRMAELATAIAKAIPLYLAELQVIKAAGTERRAVWDDLDAKRKAAWAADYRETAVGLRDAQDNEEFATIAIGEQYHQWNERWNTQVSPLLLELLALIEATRAAMEKKANAPE